MGLPTCFFLVHAGVLSRGLRHSRDRSQSPTECFACQCVLAEAQNIHSGTFIAPVRGEDREAPTGLERGEHPCAGAARRDFEQTELAKSELLRALIVECGSLTSRLDDPR